MATCSPEASLSAVSIRTFAPADISAVEALQGAYAEAFPGGPLLPGGLYCSPAFHGGEDVFCALESGRLLAYAPLYLQPAADDAQPQIAWIEIKAAPDLPDPLPVKDALLARLVERARALAGGRVVRLTFEYRLDETPAWEYALARGFAYLESAYSLVRAFHDTLLPIVPMPAGISVRRWKMESEAEQRAYLAARNGCFPHAQITLEHWQHYLSSPQWAAGTMIAAFAGETLAGAVHVYWSEAENQSAERPFGYTEDIFVCAPYRGQGVARAAIVEGMRYLQEHSLQEARLTVAARNENALALYRQLGYHLERESRFYAKVIE